MNTTAGATTPRPTPTVDLAVAGPLVGEHAVLLRDVRHLADPVLALLAQTHSWPHAELGTAHVQLHTLTEQLDEVDAASCSAVGLRGLVEQLLHVLEHHLVQEQAVLAGHQTSDNSRSFGG